MKKIRPRKTLKREQGDTVDAYAQRLEPKRRALFAKVRSIIRSTAPRLSEGISWGNPTYWMEGKKKRYLLWLYAYPKTEYVNFGFFEGRFMKDPKKRLEGSGITMRHIKVYTAKDVDPGYFRALIQQAVRRAAP